MTIKSFVTSLVVDVEGVVAKVKAAVEADLVILKADFEKLKDEVEGVKQVTGTASAVQIQTPPVSPFPAGTVGTVDIPAAVAAVVATTLTPPAA